MRSISVDGIEISQLILGSDYFRPDQIDHVFRVIDAYIDIGGDTIDTAYIYQGGESEKAVGLWLSRQKDRERLRIFTKGAHHNAEGPQVNPEAIHRELTISLERLQTPYVDLYALHRDDPTQAVGPIVEALNRELEDGRIRAFGGSNWTWQRLQEANRYANEHGLRGFSFSSPNLSLAKAIEPYWPGCLSVDAEMLAWHQQTKLPILSWSSQARGFFTGRFGPEDHSDAQLVRVFYNEANWERYHRAEQLGQERGVAPIEIALAYVLNQSFPTAAIIGPQNESEVASCREGADIVLTEAEVRWLDLTDEVIGEN